MTLFPQGVSPALVQFDPVAATGLAVAAGVCLIGPILAGLWWHHRIRAPLAAFGAGALVFLVSQVTPLSSEALGSLL